VFVFSELNSGACSEMKLEGDAAEGSGDHTQEFQQGLIDATNILKWKLLKTKLLLSRCQIGCRFPELGQRGNPTCGTWIHLLLLVTLLVGLSSSPYCVFSSRFVLYNSSCNLWVFVPWISMGCHLVWTSVSISCLYCELCSYPALVSQHFKCHK
jgi:hypothetical protein